MRPVSILAATLAITALGAPTQAAEGQFQRTLTVSGPVRLDVSGEAGAVSVRAGSEGQVEVRGYLKSTRWVPGAEKRLRELEREPPIAQRGGTIVIGHAERLRGISIRYEIVTPHQSQLRAHTDSGGMHVKGIRGPVECEVDSGGLEIEGIDAGVTASVDSGGIRVRDIQGPVSAKADSGGVRALRIAGAVEVSSDSGGVEVEQTLAAPVRVQADSGGARVKLAPSAGYNLRVKADSGQVRVKELTISGEVSRDRVDGRVRGGGPLVDVDVDSGGITIE